MCDSKVSLGDTSMSVFVYVPMYVHRHVIFVSTRICLALKAVVFL